MAGELMPPSWNSMVIDSNIILPSYSYIQNSGVFYTNLYVIDADSMSVLTSYSSSLIYNKYIYPAFETILSSTSLSAFAFVPQFHTDSNIYFYGLIITGEAPNQNTYASYIVTDLQLNFISSNSSIPNLNTSIIGFDIYKPMSGMALSDTSFLLVSLSTTYITDPSFDIQYSYQAPTDSEIYSFCFDGTYIYLYLWNYDNDTFRIAVLNTELELITQTPSQSSAEIPASTIFSTGENLIVTNEPFTPIAPMLVVNTSHFDNTLNLYVAQFYVYVLVVLRNGKNQLLIVYESPVIPIENSYSQNLPAQSPALFSTKNKKYINDWSRNTSYYTSNIN